MYTYKYRVLLNVGNKEWGKCYSIEGSQNGYNTTGDYLNIPNNPTHAHPNIEVVSEVNVLE